MKRIKVRSAKNKGANFQKEIAKKIAILLDIPFDNTDDNALIQTRQMGQHGTDIILRGKALTKFSYSIECKSSQHWNLPAAIKQVRNNIKKNTKWLLFLRRKEFKKSFVVLETDDFFDLIRNLLKYEKLYYSKKD